MKSLNNKHAVAALIFPQKTGRNELSAPKCKWSCTKLVIETYSQSTSSPIHIRIFCCFRQTFWAIHLGSRYFVRKGSPAFRADNSAQWMSERMGMEGVLTAMPHSPPAPYDLHKGGVFIASWVSIHQSCSTVVHGGFIHTPLQFY